MAPNRTLQFLERRFPRRGLLRSHFQSLYTDLHIDFESGLVFGGSWMREMFPRGLPSK